MRMHAQHDAGAGGARLAKLAAIWLVISAMLAGFGAAAFTMLSRPPDAAVLCEAGSEIAVSSVVLVDTTDALTEIQQRRVRTTIEAERDRLVRGGKLSILAINAEEPEQPFELFSACNPGRAADENPLFVTTSAVDKRWIEKFAGPIERAIKEVTSAAGAESSPIIVSIAAVMTRPDFDARVPERRLLILSDMLQHEPNGYTQLGGGDIWKTFSQSDLAQRASLDLRGVTVAIDYLMREKYARVQGEKHRAFWQRLFVEAGATSVSFIGRMPPVRGDGVDSLDPLNTSSGGG